MKLEKEVDIEDIVCWRDPLRVEIDPLRVDPER